MAGAGYKLFNTGDVLTAAQVNTYLQQQTVMVFADASARTTALTSVLAEGMMSYLQDTNAVEVYNGSAWVGVASGEIPLTTKGDLLTYSTQNTRLGVGANGTYLQADSTTATGLKWANSPTTAPQVILQAAPYYVRTPSLVAPGSQSATEDTTYYTPIYLSGISFDRISCRTSSTHTGTSTARLGIYNADTSTGKPSTVYLDAGTVSCSASNTIYEITISNTPPAGFYWLAFNVQTKTGASNFFAADAGQNALASSTMDTISSTNKYSYWNEASVTGAFATAGTLTISTGSILVALRMA